MEMACDYEDCDDTDASLNYSMLMETVFPHVMVIVMIQTLLALQT